MPIQKSNQGQPVTSSPFTQPFETKTTRFGVKGININDAIDALEPDELSRMFNVYHRQDAFATSRAGQTTVLSGLGTNVHSVRRLNDPNDDSFIRVIGADANLFKDAVNIDSGYSGSPLSMVPYKPKLSGEPWMFIGDTARMRKVRGDGLDLPIGLPIPSVRPTTALGTQQKTVIANFESDDTVEGNWVGNEGLIYGTDPPEYINLATVDAFGTGQGDDLDAYAMAFRAQPYPGPTDFPAIEGYYAFWGCPHAVDLSMVGAVPATDDDYMHIYVNFSHANLIDELRVYFVCSETFDATVVPGNSGQTGANGDAYVKSFSSNDFASFVNTTTNQTESAETARVRSLRDEDLRRRGIDITDERFNQNPNSELSQIISATDVSRTVTEQANPASDHWQKFGVIGVPLRRGDFQRIGSTEGRDWSNITGISVFLKAGPGAATTEGRISHMYMTGGSGPDSGLAQSSPYDYRYTHYDTRTGAEGNPSDEQDANLFLDSLRRSIVVTPTAYGDAAIRQYFYRRGGTLPTDWFLVGHNTSDGGAFTDEITDTEASTSIVVEIDNDQPVSTVNSSGTTILNQPLSSLWGPLQDLLMGCGDPYRPGHVYFCKPGEPDSWPPENHTEVCSPSEELMRGCLYGGQAFVFSGERLFILYPNLSGDGTSVTSTVSQCSRGMINRWALAVGIGGMYFVNRDGVYRTTGGPEDWISRKIDPLFRGKTVNGMPPINFNGDCTGIRLEIHENELWMLYQDTTNCARCAIYNIPYQYWRPYTFDKSTSVAYSDEGNVISTLLFGGLTTGKVYSHTGYSDDGATIQCLMRTGSIDFGRPREEKRFGDMVLNTNTHGVTVSVQNLLNNETLTNPSQTVSTSSRKDIIFDSFGTEPQAGRTIASEIGWTSSTAAPEIFWLGGSIIVEPDITVNRVTQWDDLGQSDEFYLTGVTFDCDTNGVTREIIVESDFNGATSTVATLSVTCDGRHKRKFSWAAVQANKVRIRPTGDCEQWILYKADWIATAEPPRIAKWDTHFENGWDNYYTGVDLYCDTNNQNKLVAVYVDGVFIKAETVSTNGRRVHHITLPWGRGHVFHLIATDDNPGLLYDVRWQLDPEPSEQTNWNQNFSVEGIESDKFLKAIVFQCDTFGQDKTVTVECDGVVVETLTVNTNGRKVVQKAFPQHLGRVFRVYPTDDNPSRLYSIWWVFDQEPLALDRWETQEITHGTSGWHYPIYSHVGIKSVSEVTLTLTAYNQLGVATSKVYTISSTLGAKRKVFVPFEAMKGILFKYVFTSDEPFWLYREETSTAVRVWGSDVTLDAHIFGNDDLDVTRIMTKPALAAARSGGGTG